MMKNKTQGLIVILILVLLVQGCNIPVTSTEVPATPPPATDPPPPAPTTVQHQDIPISAPESELYPDVVSLDTAPEQRAPYGDSYDLNRLERPFTQDMSYNPDVDISSFGISEDGDWYYVSIGMVGKDPNNPANIQFSVELDTNLDSFGDILIVAQPPYSDSWTTENLKIFADSNRDSAGRNPAKSDAPFSGNGFDQLVHSFSDGIGEDIDVAWVRINAGPQATVQFAFKKSFSGSSFFYSVMADAGLKDVARHDYVDYFTESEAGSSVRSNPYYPLKSLYAVDNTCYQAFGFASTGFEPKVCPIIVQPVQIKNPLVPGGPTAPACQLTLEICLGQGYGDFNPLTCQCIPIG